MSKALGTQGKSCLGQMIENHRTEAQAGRSPWSAEAARPTRPPFAAAAAAAGRPTPRGGAARLSLLPLAQRPFGFLAKAQGAEAGQ
jgi:hypothetical protein